MKLRNIQLRTRLFLSFGLFLLLILIMGTLSYHQSDILWRQTSNLYASPLKAQKSVGEIKTEILSMYKSMKDIILMGSHTGIDTFLRDIEVREARALQEFDTLYLAFREDKPSIDAAFQEFISWRSVRDEIIRQFLSGDTTTPEQRILFAHMDADQVEKLMLNIGEISRLIADSASRYYEKAEQQQKSLRFQLILLVLTAAFLSMLIGYELAQSIRKPLNELILAASRYRQGHYNTRSRYHATNEFGRLSSGFNRMADTVQNTLQVKEASASFAEEILQKDTLEAFCEQVLRSFLTKTTSQTAALFFADEETQMIRHYRSIGLDAEKIRAFSIDDTEGELGLALVEKKIIHTQNIPDNTRFIHPCTSGDFCPREMITIPILENTRVIAFVSLASLHKYSHETLQFVHDVHALLTARIHSILAMQKVQETSMKLELQNRELEQQSRELQKQSDEMREYNIELEMQKKQLNEANQLKSTFLSNMSHELRTPLNSVIALSGVLLKKLHEKIPEESFQYLSIIERNGKALLSLINDILDLSRIESGREEVYYTSFSLKNLFEQISQRFVVQSHEKGIEMIYQIPGDIVLESDESKCLHIFQNLIANAVKFTEKGSVRVEVEKGEQHIRVVVRDTGIGIAPEHLSKIFDEFRQADELASRKYGGTGLGLSIARKYARILGGDISVFSTAGKGSEFTVVLPLQPSHPHSTGGKQENEEASAGILPEDSLLAGKSILLVEDSEPALIQLVDILREEGCEVQIARNGKEALAQIQQSTPDAMILDLMMPEIDGFEVLKQVRSLGKTSRLPVLILSAKHITRQELSFLRNNHVDQLIQKGDLHRHELLQRIHAILKPESIQEKYSLPRILLVEDHPDNRTTIKALLEGKAEILEANDGLEGLNLAKTHLPDLILMDISLPGMDGLEALEKLHQDKGLRKIPVIALTARAMKGDREEFMQLGFDEYLSKPLDEALFQKTLRKFLRGF